MPTQDGSFRAEFPFGNAKHSEMVLTSFESFRKNGTFCDITLVVGNEEFRVHKVILASASSYFAAMFSSDMIESRREKIVLKELDPRAVSVVLDYIYTGRILIEPDAVHALLPAASLLQLNSIREACSDFLASNLAPENCLGIRAFALIHSCEKLESAAHFHALANFDSVVKSEEFLEIGIEDIEKFLSSDALDTDDESKVFEALIKWINHSHSERCQYFGRLLKATVRLPFVSSQFLLNHICREPLVLSSLEAQAQLISAMRYQMGGTSGNRLEDFAETVVRRRQCSILKNDDDDHHHGHPIVQSYIFSIGGGSLFSVHNECEVYDPRKGEWSMNVPQCLVRRSRASVTCLSNNNRRKFILVGGYNGTKDLSSTEIFDSGTNCWMEAPAMGSRRSALGLIELNDFIYAIGGGSTDGGSSSSCHASAEMFDPLAERWLSVPALEIRRRGLGVVAQNGAIFAIGGHDGSNHLASVERLDPREGKWKAIQPMIGGRRSGLGATVYDGKIYVAGGSDGSLCVASTERYDCVANRWETLAPMSIRRTTHELVTLDNHLYALGGNDGTNSLAIVEVYDPNKNRWTMGHQMKMRRSSMAACVVDCSNTHDWFQNIKIVQSSTESSEDVTKN